MQTNHMCKQKSIQCREEIQQYRKRSMRYITWPGKISSLVLCKKGDYNYRPQATGGNIQERCDNIITKTTTNTPQNTPIQSQNSIHAWPRSLHCRLPIQTKPQRWQGWRNSWYASECQHCRNSYKHPRMYNNM